MNQQHTCLLCGHAGDGFRPIAPSKHACPRCGETSGGELAKPINIVGRTRAAGLSLLFSGLLTLALSVGWMAANFAVGPPVPQPLPGQAPVALRATQLGIRFGQIAPPGLGILIASLAVAGGIQLARRRMWSLAATGAFAAALPCTCGFPIGLPVGVWALLVLSNPTVRDAFR